MRKLLSILAAVGISSAVAFAASLPNFTGPQDPSQLNATLNTLNQNIRTGVNGLVAVYTSTVNSAATTNEQTLASASIPANTLSSAGQSLRLRCDGRFNTGHAGVVTLYYGTSSVATVSAQQTGNAFNLNLLVTYDASATASKYSGGGVVGTTVVAAVASPNTTDNMASALTAKCTTTQGTASASDVSLMNFIVEQVK